jgi:hypothetical protein
MQTQAAILRASALLFGGAGDVALPRSCMAQLADAVGSGFQCLANFVENCPPAGMLPSPVAATGSAVVTFSRLLCRCVVFCCPVLCCAVLCCPVLSCAVL